MFSNEKMFRVKSHIIAVRPPGPERWPGGWVLDRGNHPSVAEEDNRRRDGSVYGSVSITPSPGFGITGDQCQ